MTPETFVARLEGVRQLRPDHWVAKCPVPAHEDKSPSLSVTVKGDGSPLFYCFGGCSGDDILAALDLSWRDIYPDRWREAEARALAHGDKRLKKIDDETPRLEQAQWVLRIAAADKREGKSHGLWDRAATAWAADIAKGGTAHG